MADINDDPDNALLNDNVRSLMAGPSGLGQNFAGFSSFAPAYLTGTLRAPFTVPTSGNVVPVWYANTSISNITVQGAYQITVDFTTPYVGTTPFALADSVTLDSVIETGGNTSYNGGYGPSVISSTLGNVSLRTVNPYDWPTYVSGGYIIKDYSNTQASTDCNAKVTVYGPTDRVFISCQTNLDFTYTCSGPSEFKILFQVNRYRGFIDRSNPLAYLYTLDQTIAQQTYDYNVTTSGSISAPETIFTSVIDSPSFGYYWYILEMVFITVSGDALPGIFTVGQRGLTAQVVKE